MDDVIFIPFVYTFISNTCKQINVKVFLSGNKPLCSYHSLSGGIGQCTKTVT